MSGKKIAEVVAENCYEDTNQFNSLVHPVRFMLAPCAGSAYLISTGMAYSPSVQDRWPNPGSSLQSRFSYPPFSLPGH
jgi:hypothetical protein